MPIAPVRTKTPYNEALREIDRLMDARPPPPAAIDGISLSRWSTPTNSNTGVLTLPMQSTPLCSARTNADSPERISNPFWDWAVACLKC